MLDARIRPWIDGPLNRIGHLLADWGVTPNLVTIAGFVLGLFAMVAIASGAFLTGLILFLANRGLDGLDGAVARATAKTDLGGYLDIVADFLIYSGLVFAFAFADPATNGLAAAALLWSFMATGCTFLAFAIMAEKRQLSTAAQGQKSLYYLSGLAEGTETILFFVVCCLWPAHFATLAWIFFAICLISAAGRVWQTVLTLR